MALPAIAPYSMPGAAELPRNKLAWTPEPKRCVLLIHDMQRYFVDAFTQGQSPVTELVANIQRLRDHAVKLGIPVVYSAQPGDQTAEQRGLQLEFRAPASAPVRNSRSSTSSPRRRTTPSSPSGATARSATRA